MIGFQVLGPVQIVVDGEVAPLRSARQRALLAALIAHLGEPLSTDRLIDAMWGEDVPESSVNTFHTHMSRLRQILGGDAADVLRRLPNGYTLDIDQDQVDATRFVNLVEKAGNEAANGRYDEAAALLTEALDLWRGPAFEDALDDTSVRSQAVRLDELRAFTREELVEARLAIGRHFELVGDIESLLLEDPLRERLWCQLMLSLYRSGRQVEAARAFERAREALAEAGISPGTSLVELMQSILDQEPSLVAPTHVPDGAERHNLPKRLSSFVGRDQEMAQLGATVRDARLVTLLGPGGSGKTTLAIEFARESLKEFPDGAWFVDLSDTDDPRAVTEVVASTLNIRPQAQRPILDQVAESLRKQRSLLILDGCEHLIDAAAAVTTKLLKRTAALHVIATSREVLAVPGEHPYPVPPLKTPQEHDRDLAKIAASPAVRLFVDRALTAPAGFQLHERNAETIGSLCRRLDGLPLAIELAVAHLNILAPSELLDRLSLSLPLPRSTTRDRPTRHRTLTATIDWSHDLLPPEEQTVFRRIGVFSGGFTLESAANICTYDVLTPSRVHDIIGRLVDKSLLVVDVGQRSHRFRFLETIGDYANAKLSTSGERTGVEKLHAVHYRQLAIDSYEAMRTEAGVAWSKRLDQESANLRKALRWHVDNQLTQEGLLMAGSLHRYWLRGYHFREGTEWLELFLAADTTPSEARARALNGLGALASDTTQRARECIAEAITLYRKLGPKYELVSALNNAGVLEMEAGQWQAAREFLSESVDLARPLDDPFALSLAIANYAFVVLQADGDAHHAAIQAEESVRVARTANSSSRLADALTWLGLMRREAQDHDGAMEAIRQALQLEASIGDFDIGNALAGLATVTLDIGEVEKAVSYFKRSYQRKRPLMENEPVQDEVPGLLLFSGRVAMTRGRPTVAAELLTAGRAFYNQSRFVQPPTEKLEYDEVIAQAQDALSPTSFRHACERGKRMTPIQALDYAIATLE